MQQQMEELKKEVQALRQQQTAPGSNAPAQPPAPSVAAAPRYQGGNADAGPKECCEGGSP